MNPENTPPHFILRFFKWFCHPDMHPYIEGDLLELYDERIALSGKKKADRQFIVDVLLLFRPDIIKPLEGFKRLNNYGMLKNYFKVSFRNILKYKTFSFINISGLAIAMSVCMLIMLMLADQKSYDNFHEKKDRIYRILMHPVEQSTYATSPYPTSVTLKNEYPIIEDATRLRRGFGGDAKYKETYAELQGYFTSPSFFNIFSYKLEQGDPKTALSQPNSIVISKDKAIQLFGYEDPLGKSIEYFDRGLNEFTSEGEQAKNWGSFTITGVFAEKDYKSHLEFDVLVSESSLELLYKEDKIADLTNEWTDMYRTYNYVLVNNNVDIDQINAAAQELANAVFKEDNHLKDAQFIAQPLSKIRPGPALGNAPTTGLPMFVYYILGVLAAVIMFSACLNYTNLSIARAITRAKEIGVRKVNGASRSNLIMQFLSESIITALLALVLANILLLFLKSAFLSLWVNQFLNFDLEGGYAVYFIFIGFAILIGLIAGSFPAFKLSSYKPIKALKNVNEISKDRLGLSKLGMRKALGVFQFVISLLFIVTSILLFNQFKYYMQFQYKFNPQNVVNINLQSNDFDKVKTAMSSIEGVSYISACAYLPVSGRNDNVSLNKFEGKDEDAIATVNLSTDDNFINTLEINLIAGKNLPAGAGAENFIIVNESVVKSFGYNNPHEIIGEPFRVGNDEVQVVGVIEDFPFHLLFTGRNTSPLLLRHNKDAINYASVKITATNRSEIVEQLEQKWKSIDPIHPIKYEFYEDTLSNNNQGIFDIVSIIGFLSFLAITIACLGLLGMAIYTTERRTKEVGIRKVLGANELNLTLLLSKEFLIILGIAVLISAPLSYFLNNLWLQFLVYKAPFGFTTVLTGVLVLLVLGLVTIAPQTFRISRQNPTDSLRSE
ncbi:MAG: hypothetical protein CMO01_01680 [Thalassobius sp.]|nr:hypothetical protein [Thalassovita sp.]